MIEICNHLRLAASEANQLQFAAHFWTLPGKIFYPRFYIDICQNNFGFGTRQDIKSNRQFYQNDMVRWVSTNLLYPRVTWLLFLVQGSGGATCWPGHTGAYYSFRHSKGPPPKYSFPKTKVFKDFSHFWRKICVTNFGQCLDRAMPADFMERVQQKRTKLRYILF